MPRMNLATASSVVLVPLLVSSLAMASSHREAPAISKDAFADNTDTYVFISPENDNNVVLAASWIPFEGPEGGPNYYEWDDSVEYYIYVDNDGDAVPDFTYKLTSQTTITNGDTFLYNTGPITPTTSANWNRQQRITVEEITSGGSVPLITNQLVAPSNIGSKSTPDYQALADQSTFTVNNGGDTIKIFGGQTDDAFFVDLQVFDLLTLRGQSSPIGYSTGNNIAVDSLSGHNVHSLVIELPISRLVAGNDPVLGVWSTSNRNGSQVSRLGMPLVNELVVQMPAKDTFNSIRPQDDLGVYTSPSPLPGSTQGLQARVENPEVGVLLCALYGVPLPGDSNNDCNTEFTAGTPRSGRGDIFDIFLQGLVLANPFTINTANGSVTLPAGFNVNRAANAVPSEMIRINTNIKGATCAPTPSRLGVFGGDACGYPNGRRLFDDTVDISLLAVAGAGYQALDGRQSFAFNPALIGVLSDGVDANDKSFSSVFPYFVLANSGQEHIHTNPVAASTTPTPVTPSSSATPTSFSGSGGGGAVGGFIIACLLGAGFGVRRLRRK